MVFLLDGTNILFRSYYAMRALTTPDGQPCGAALGFTRTLLSYVKSCDGIAVAFDLPEPTFRHEQYDGYKGTRAETPADLLSQIPMARDICAYLGVPALAISGYEADDLIGTWARLINESGGTCTVVSGDADLLQLVRDGVSVLSLSTDITYTPDNVSLHYGVSAAQVVDLKALMGDKSDNIPGVKGIGQKGAVTLLSRFGTLDGIYANIDDKSITPSVRAKLIAGKEDAYASRTLATICTTAPVEITHGLPTLTPTAATYLKQLGFNSVVKQLEQAQSQAQSATQQQLSFVSDAPNVELPQEVALMAYVLDPDNVLTTEALCTKYGASPDELSDTLTRLLHEHGQYALYNDVELPLSDVLKRMSATGVRADRTAFERLRDEWGAQAESLAAQIYAEAGSVFNLNSPKQLGEVLFGTLGLTPTRKTQGKTGYSTDAEALHELRHAHPIIPLISQYRAVSKLKGTYADGLLSCIADDGRIHSTFTQTVTATGRLSSVSPNMQNIPQRTAEGRRVRAAFVPDDGCVFVSADYSQIELRILAHLSCDPVMRQAFAENADIHTTTAAGVFNVSPGQVTSDMRRMAKVVNFGIIYGMSEYGLSRDLDIPIFEAKQYIAEYFDLYRGVDAYMKTLIEQAKADGYVTTILGRRRYIAEREFRPRGVGERLARNTPIQGSGADIIKVAMVRTDRALCGVNGAHPDMPPARLVLQIHDELVIECHASVADEVAVLLQREMENAVQLEVPLVADVEVSDSL